MPEEGILLSHSRENLKSYIKITHEIYMALSKKKAYNFNVKL
jgi:hypothetical protein